MSILTSAATATFCSGYGRPSRCPGTMSTISVVARIADPTTATRTDV